MPRGKKKGGRKNADSRPPSDEEYDTADNLSTVSVQSDDIGSIAEEAGENGEVDETTAQEELEEKLKEYIDDLTQKSSKGRLTCLMGIQRALSKKYLYSFLVERKETLTDCLGRCMKKGKGEEQGLAASCAALLCIQLGQEGETTLQELRPIMSAILTDNSASLKARAKCAIGLAMCSFIASNDIHEIMEVMDKLKAIFKASYKRGDQSIPSHTSDLCGLHTAALEGWSFLLTLAPNHLISKVIDSELPKLPDLLDSPDVDLRIASGETIALLYELAREDDEEFEGDDLEGLCDRLKKLATDSNKFRAKKDRRQQRSSFRDILRAVEEGDAPETSVRFGRETLDLMSWVHKRQYDGLCSALGTGMNQHLLENDLIRDVFGLGSPIPVSSQPIQKVSRTQRHLFNAAAFKARTKARAKYRDKRAVTANGSY